MKKIKLSLILCSLSFLLFLVFTSTQTLALNNIAEIESYKGIYTIISDKVIVEENIQFSAVSKTITLAIPEDAAALEVKNAEFEVEEFKDYKLLTINKKLNTSFTIKYITESLIEETDNNYFILDLGNLEAPEIIVKLILPESATLKYPLSSPQPSIFPTTKKVTTDGKSINIYWDETDLKESKTLMVMYKENKQFSLKLILVPIVVLMSLVVIFFSYFKHRSIKSKEDITATTEKENNKFNNTKIESNEIEDNKEQIKKDLTRNLFEEERAIIETLFEADNQELWQKQLVLKTGISKVKLSRKIRNLEAKSLIEKIPFGNTNKIRLKDKNADKVE
ncbi:hypothetical protein HYU21_02280 [Candidatus Woesearchaeota archaeon]|nr:hypothetical protein [Candidatus Woesearchaeota archaeon]